MKRPALRFPFARMCSTALAGSAAALILAVSTTGSLAAQTQVLAFYPLLTDLFDATAQNGPVALTGNNVPAPNPPNNGVCHNGVYYYSAGGGQNIQTPLMPSLTTTDFQVNVEFTLAALPTTMFPVLMGGN